MKLLDILKTLLNIRKAVRGSNRKSKLPKAY
ncbi:hypothetical protein N752_11535 [Desulforamulus aquiferis]|nr:hypothetical protein N752_11535 [Desulforamulus aquiferis]